MKLQVEILVIAMIAALTHFADLGLAQETSEAAQETSEAAQEVAPKRKAIEEIVVTANRRSQNLQEIAGGIDVIGGAELEQSSAGSFEDYLFSIPGVDIASDGFEKKIAIRGVSNAAGPTVGYAGSTSPIGIYLNDTPIQGNGVIPDLGLFDIERVEVLKGPQGTLYGEGAQGGAIRMLLNSADPSEYAAKGDFGVGKTYNGSGLNHFQNVMLNVPVFGSWAARVVGSHRVDQGYIDYPNAGGDGANDVTNMTGRLHVDGDVWEGFSASALLMHQRQRFDQLPDAQVNEGDLVNLRSEPQFIDVDFTLAGITLDYDLGFAELTSATSWFRNDREALGHQAVLESIASASAGFPLPPPAEEEWFESSMLQFGVSQELRLVSPGDGWLHWVAGGFYRFRENDMRFFENDSVSNMTPPPQGPGFQELLIVESFEQFALFGEATAKLPWNLELTVGLRGFRESARADTIIFGRGATYPVVVAVCGCPEGSVAKDLKTTTTAFTPKVSLSWFADEDRMVYATYAQGVRSGGLNPAAVIDGPPGYKPDQLSSYEVGVKTQWFDGALTANTSIFYLDWKDLQVQGLRPSNYAPGVTIDDFFYVNVGRAISRGVELELLALPLSDLTLGFNLFVGEGKITEGSSQVPPGPIPQSPKLSYAASASYAPTAWSFFGFEPFFNYGAQQVGDRVNRPPHPETLEPYELEGFLTHNVLVGIASERYELTFGLDNLTDVRKQLGVSPFDRNQITTGRPRTWTTRFAFRF